MGLPEVLIEFKAASSTAINRIGQGVVALILRDETAEGTSYSYGKMSAVSGSDWSDENAAYIRLAFLGNPGRVLVERIGTDDEYTDVLLRLKNKKWNYLAIPGLASEDQKEIGDWIIDQRSNKKTFKAVLANYDGDHEAIINFATDGIVTAEKTYTSAEYCARIAGLIAGLGVDSACTYEVLPEVKSITESADPDSDIDAGKLILINDGANIKIARGINSLVTMNGKTADMKKIKIVDAMDLMRDDIASAFENNYIGIANSYDNKLLFINAVNVYLAGLVRDNVLYDEYDNTAQIDVEAQRAWLENQDPKYADYSDEEIKKADTKSFVFAACDVKFQDAIEDLHFTIYM